MKKNKNICIILLVVFCLINITACSNKTEKKDEVENQVAININQQKENNENNENEINSNEEEYSTTSLFDEVFEVFSNKIGKSNFEEDESYVKSLTNYSVEVTIPDDESIGRIKVSDESGDYVSLLYYPQNGKETLTLVAFNRNGYEISISNELHELNTLKYTTYDINATEKNKNVSDIDDLKKFMFVEIGDGKSKTSDKIDVYLNIQEVKTSEGKVYFEIDTNLPDETSLMVSVEGVNYNASSKVSIDNNRAITEPFSNKGNALESGEYTVKVTMPVPSIQSNAVRDIIGNIGENMVGDLVIKSSIGESYIIEKQISISL